MSQLKFPSCSDDFLTLEVERNVSIALSELITGITPVVSTVLLGGVRYRQSQQVCVLARLLQKKNEETICQCALTLNVTCSLLVDKSTFNMADLTDLRHES